MAEPVKPEAKNGGKEIKFSAEIEKYAAALAKDPKSRAFAPLAEAYRRAGMLEEAILVAQEGLKIHPTYHSGRVALGRAYFEKGMLAEAAQELETVVKATPDNIIAQRILGEVYFQQGDKEKAQSRLNLVLTLNPGDKEAQERLQAILAPPPPPEPAEEKPGPEIEPALSLDSEESKAESAQAAPDSAVEPEPAPPPAEAADLALETLARVEEEKPSVPISPPESLSPVSSPPEAGLEAEEDFPAAPAAPDTPPDAEPEAADLALETLARVEEERPSQPDIQKEPASEDVLETPSLPSDVPGETVESEKRFEKIEALPETEPDLSPETITEEKAEPDISELPEAQSSPEGGPEVGEEVPGGKEGFAEIEMEPGEVSLPESASGQDLVGDVLGEVEMPSVLEVTPPSDEELNGEETQETDGAGIEQAPETEADGSGEVPGEDFGVTDFPSLSTEEPTVVPDLREDQPAGADALPGSADSEPFPEKEESEAFSEEIRVQGAESEEVIGEEPEISIPIESPRAEVVEIPFSELPAEESEADAPAEPGTGKIATSTIAEIYVGQGHLEKAVEVYREILTENPDDQQAGRRLEELTRRLKGVETAAAETEKKMGEGDYEDRKIRVLKKWLEEIEKMKAERHVKIFKGE